MQKTEKKEPVLVRPLVFASLQCASFWVYWVAVI